MHLVMPSTKDSNINRNDAWDVDRFSQLHIDTKQITMWNLLICFDWINLVLKLACDCRLRLICYLTFCFVKWCDCYRVEVHFKFSTKWSWKTRLGGGGQWSRLRVNFWLYVRLKNDCIWIKNQHISRNEIFPNVLGKCELHHALGTSTLDFI